MFCGNCGKEVGIDDKFCQYCGDKIDNSYQFNVNQGQSNVNQLAIEQEKAAFANVFPHLTGCVAANFKTRFLRGILLNLMIIIPTKIVDKIAFSLSFSLWSVLFSLAFSIGLLVLQIVLLRKNGMNLPDYIMKTKWVDVATGQPMSSKGIFWQLATMDGLPLILGIIAIIPTFRIILQLNSYRSFSSYNLTATNSLMTSIGVLVLILIVFQIFALILFVGSIVAFVQIYNDKATHRCWLDKLGSVVVIDTKKGRDPLPYKPFGSGK